MAAVSLVSSGNVDSLLRLSVRMAGNKEVQKDASLFNLFKDKIESLIYREPNQQLSRNELEFFILTEQLLDDANKVNSSVTPKVAKRCYNPLNSITSQGWFK